MSLLVENKISISQKIIHLNWLLIFLIFLLSVTGILMLYSAAGGVFKPWLVKQIVYFIIFFPVMIAIAVIDIRFWFKTSYLAYAIGIIFLIIVSIKGYNSMGATRWFRIAGITVQPSEITKLFTIMALAKYFYNIEAEDIQKFRYILAPIVIIALPALLVLDQPDLGTAIILVLAGVSALFMAGVKAWKFIAGGVSALVAIPFLWYFVLYDYQKSRVLTFLKPDSDPTGAGYNITQSKIAIGSGGLYGKGYLNGTQGQLDFLPERQTDFIFTMLTEELGFIGGVSTIILYSLIIYYGTAIALKSKHQFGKLLAIGVVNIFFLHMFINMGMVMGLLPVVGTPLPLISYGGTITATMLISFGLLLNVDLYANTQVKSNI
jgi:rod shape determining protein RodA